MGEFVLKDQELFVDKHFETFYLAHLLRDPRFAQHVRPDISPELFSSQTTQALVRIALEYYDQYKAPPAELIISEVNQHKYLSSGLKAQAVALAEELLSKQIKARDRIIKQHDDYIRNKKLLYMVRSVVDLAKDQDFDKIQAEIHDYITWKPRGTLDPGSTMDDVDARVARRLQADEDNYAFLIPPLDKDIKLRKKELWVWQSQRSNVGKAQPLSAKILGASGWMTMGELKVGDTLASVDGAPSEVVGVFPQGKKQVFKITFSDGRSTRATGEHLWRVTRNTWNPKWKTLTTENIASRLHALAPIIIPTHAGCWGEKKDFVISPWLLGVYLGDGSSSGRSYKLSNTEKPLLSRVSDELRELGMKLSSRACGKEHTFVRGSRNNARNPFGVELLRLGLYNKRSWEKFIPSEYMGASYEQRLELLRGLLDTDGTVAGGKTPTYTSTSETLATQVVELVRGLGMLASIKSRVTSFTYLGVKKKGRRSWRVTLTHLTDNPFWLPRKADKVAPKVRNRNLSISSIEPDGFEETQCIAVSHPSHLYITDDHIVTHNTAALVFLTKSLVLQGAKVVYYCTEESEEDIQDRLDMCVAALTEGQLTNKVAIDSSMRRWFNGGQAGDYLRIKAFEGMVSVQDLRDHTALLRNHYGFYPDVVIIDYADELEPSNIRLIGDLYACGKDVYSGLKTWAKEEDLLVWTAMQSSRSAIEKPVADQGDTGQSIAKVQLTDGTISINRTPAQAEAGQTVLFVVKHRRGRGQYSITIQSDMERQLFYVRNKE